MPDIVEKCESAVKSPPNPKISPVVRQMSFNVRSQASQFNFLVTQRATQRQCSFKRPSQTNLDAVDKGESQNENPKGSGKRAKEPIADARDSPCWEPNRSEIVMEVCESDKKDSSEMTSSVSDFSSSISHNRISK